MSKPVLVAVAVVGAVALLAVFAALDMLTLGGILTVVWAGAWLYRFWELR